MIITLKGWELKPHFTPKKLFSRKRIIVIILIIDYLYNIQKLKYSGMYYYGGWLRATIRSTRCNYSKSWLLHHGEEPARWTALRQQGQLDRAPSAFVGGQEAGVAVYVGLDEARAHAVYAEAARVLPGQDPCVRIHGRFGDHVSRQTDRPAIDLQRTFFEIYQKLLQDFTHCFFCEGLRIAQHFPRPSIW